jgi:hypothetical protein
MLGQPLHLFRHLTRDWVGFAEAIQCGAECGVRDDGSVECWGSNIAGRCEVPMP